MSYSGGLHSQARLKQDKTRRDKTRLEVTSRISETVPRLLMSGLVAQENLEKIRDETGLLSTIGEILILAFFLLIGHLRYSCALYFDPEKTNPPLPHNA